MYLFIEKHVRLLESYEKSHKTDGHNRSSSDGHWIIIRLSSDFHLAEFLITENKTQTL